MLKDVHERKEKKEIRVAVYIETGYYYCFFYSKGGIFINMWCLKSLEDVHSSSKNNQANLRSMTQNEIDEFEGRHGSLRVLNKKEEDELEILNKKS